MAASRLFTLSFVLLMSLLTLCCLLRVDSLYFCESKATIS